MPSAANRSSKPNEKALPKVLLVEDDPAMARLIGATLEAGPWDLTHAENGADALQTMAQETPDAVLLDLQLPDMHGFEVLRAAVQRSTSPAVVVLTAEATLDMAVSAMREGAVDFIAKPFNAARLLKTLTAALESGAVKREIVRIQQDHERHSFDDLVGASAPMQAVYRMIEKVAPSKASIFITGESGTGKDVVARAIHGQSGRAGPFVALNCGAIPKDLMESELFGHVKGAFTGATGDRMGAARRAHGGTLFLDEIGEMDINLQSKLLRFIQTGDVQPVGGNETHSVDVRFVCATNRDPQKAVRMGLLREDLFYRLNVIPFSLPPLRDRDSDVMTIASHFLDLFAQEEGKEFTGFAPETEEILRAHTWPGNVRELQNVIRRLVVLNDGPLVTPGMLPSDIRKARPAHFAPSLSHTADPHAIMEEILPLWQIEKQAIERAIALCEGNIVLAAARLGINPSTIYRKRQSWSRGAEAAE